MNNFAFQPNFGMPNPYTNTQFGYNSPQLSQIGYNGYNQQQIQPQNEVLQGTVVDSLDVVKGRNCPLDGSASYFPKSDLSEIYVKKLNPQTGAGMLLTYKLSQPEEIPQGNDNLIDARQVIQMLTSLSGEMSELKNIVMENLTAPTLPPKGGDKK